MYEMVFDDLYWQMNLILKSIFVFIHDLLHFIANLQRDHITQKTTTYRHIESANLIYIALPKGVKIE